MVNHFRCWCLTWQSYKWPTWELLPAACLHRWPHMALPRESVATKFSCGFLEDGGGGDLLHCGIEKQMRMLNALHILTRGWRREKMTFFLVLRIKLTLACFSPAPFLWCAARSTVAALQNCSLHIPPRLLLLSGEQPDQNGCDPTPRITPFAMEMRTWRLLTMCSSESSC